MKLSIVNLSLLALGVTAQNSIYQRYCPKHDDGRSYEISPNYRVEYKCNTLGPYGGAPIAATSAKDCAEVCKGRQNCKGSSWISTLNLCYLSGNSPQRQFADTIYLKQVSDDTKTKLPSCNKAN